MNELLYNNYEIINKYKEENNKVYKSYFDIGTTIEPMNIYDYFIGLSCFKIDSTEIILHKIHPLSTIWEYNVFLDNGNSSECIEGLIKNWKKFLYEEIFDEEINSARDYELKGFTLDDFEFITYNFNILLAIKASLIVMSRLTQPYEFDENCVMTQKINNIIFSNFFFEQSPARVDLDNLVLEILLSAELFQGNSTHIIFRKSSLGRAFQKMLLDSSCSSFFKNNKGVKFLTYFY